MKPALSLVGTLMSNELLRGATPASITLAGRALGPPVGEVVLWLATGGRWGRAGTAVGLNSIEALRLRPPSTALGPGMSVVGLRGSVGGAGPRGDKEDSASMPSILPLRSLLCAVEMDLSSLALRLELAALNISTFHCPGDVAWGESGVSGSLPPACNPLTARCWGADLPYAKDDNMPLLLWVLPGSPSREAGGT